MGNRTRSGETEADHITSLRNGSTMAFGYYYDLFYPRLVFFAEGIIADPLSAEDIVEDVFIRFWYKRTDFETEKYIRSFLYVSVKNACLDHLRHLGAVSRSEAKLAYWWEAQKAHIVDMEEEREKIMREAIRAEVSQQLFDAIEMLPDRCKQIFKLSYFHKMHNRSVAEQLRLSVFTVRNQKAIAMKILRSILLHQYIYFLLLLVQTAKFSL